MPSDPNEPLRWNATLPNGQPLRWNTPGARWGGKVGDVMAALEGNTTPMPSKYNRISITITDETVNQVLEHMDGLEQSLANCVSLTDDERQGLVKLGPKTIGFDEKAHGYMQTHPQYISALFPAAEYLKDRAARAQLLRFNARLQLLARRAEDTVMLLGSEMLRADLAYMQNAGEAAIRGGQAEAEPIYDDLSASYPGPGKAKTPPTPPTP